MKRLISALGVLLVSCFAQAEEATIWELTTENGAYLTQICYEPQTGDEYISADNLHYEVVSVDGSKAIVTEKGRITLPLVDWDLSETQAVVAKNRAIGLYCTHSDESYLPTDGYYSTTDRGSIYLIAQSLADALQEQGVDAVVSYALHHPHDAGAYRRSRQTAIDLIRSAFPDCLIDIHRDGIPDPGSYETSIGDQAASKIRLLVGRGNQNAEMNKEFALSLKAVADRVYPGLIKDIYMGKGAFNQDLLPRSILFECGTYTMDKERVLVSMPMMADVLQRTLYGGLVGSIGRSTTDVQENSERGSIVQGEPDPMIPNEGKSVASGATFLGVIFLIGTAGIAFLSAKSFKEGRKKFKRNMSEMTGGLIGTPPDKEQERDRS